MKFIEFSNKKKKKIAKVTHCHDNNVKINDNFENPYYGIVVSLFVSATFTGVETLVSSDSVNVENTFYLLWYACP